jgi:Tfp pilus assembly protein PilO
MKAKRSNRTLLVVLGALAIVVVYLLVWRPRAAELSDVRGERDTMTQQLAALQASPPGTSAGASSGTSSATTGPPVVSALAKAIPDHPELAELLRQFQSVALDTGVSQSSVSPSPLQPTGAGPGSTVTVDISVSGPRPALYEYLRRLARLDRLFVVDKMTLAPAGSDASATSTDVSVPADGFHLDVSGRAFTTTAPSGSAHG